MSQAFVDVTRLGLFRLALVALWLPTACHAVFVYDSHNDDTITNTGVNSNPSPSPPHDTDDHSYDDSTGGNTQSTISGSSSRLGASAGNGIDFLVAAFFLIAAGWLVLALIYSILVLIVVRLRARGQLDVYDDNFGRFYLLGSRCYIPFGCVLRRYVIAMNQERNTQGDPVTVRLMTREERRMAMEKLLDEQNGQKQEEDADKTETKDENEDAVSNNESPEESGHTDQTTVETNTQADGIADDASEEEPVCTICLTEYEPTDECFTSSVCSHQFHRTCILEWLQRRSNTECPCCRTPLVTDEQVWTTVQDMREERRRQIRKASRGGCCSCFRRDGHEPSMSQDDGTVDPTPPPSPAPTNLTSFGSVDSPDDVAAVENVESAQASPDLEEGRRLHYE